MGNSGNGSVDEIVQYWESGFLSYEKDPSSFYDLNQLPLVTQASHYRRMELLDALPIGDVEGKVCVDFGVGPWGFAAIYPRLHHCALAIGVDISKEAVRMSVERSSKGEFPYGQNFRYFVSNGNEIDLEDNSVDIFFNGELIEHVDNTDAFLDEAHRILKPDGFFILTTPNADALLYKAHGERYCVNAEHVSLLSYSELQAYLEPRFEQLVAKGFNGSFYRGLDEKVKDDEFAKAWAVAFENQPELATGIIILARKKADYEPRRYAHDYFHHSSERIVYKGEWEPRTLHGPITGRLGRPQQKSSLSLEFEGHGAIINFWCHDWSGFAEVDFDGEQQLVNLYSPVHGFGRLQLNCAEGGSHRLEIRAGEKKDERSKSCEVIVSRIIGYTISS